MKFLKKSKKKKYLIFIKNNFEKKGFYISYKWFGIKKKNKILKKKQIKYIITDGYIIPEPSEEAFKKQKKVKYTLFNKNFNLIYNGFNVEYDSGLEGSDLIYHLGETYSPSNFPYFIKYDILLKFELNGILKKVFFFFKLTSLNNKYQKFYFSFNKLKLFSIKIVDAFFEKFINPNKPLVGKKGNRLVSKKRGTALLGIRKIIFGQLVYEAFNEKFSFTKGELKLLNDAEINPFDSKYYWPARGLYLLNLSSFSGKLSTWSQVTIPYFNYYANYFLLVVEGEIRLKIIKQIVFWGRLFNIHVYHNLFFATTLSPAYKTDGLRINNYSIPYFYYGYHNEFFKKNYLFSEVDVCDFFYVKFYKSLKDSNVTSSSFFSIFQRLEDLDYTKKLIGGNYVAADTKRLVFPNSKEIVTVAVVNHNVILDNSDTNQIFSDYAMLVQNLSVEDVNDKIFSKINKRPRIRGVYPIPFFLGELFLLFSTKLVNIPMLEEKFIKGFLYNHPVYLKARDLVGQFKELSSYSLYTFKRRIFFQLNKLKKLKFNPIFGYKIFLFFFSKFSKKSFKYIKKLNVKFKTDFLNYLLMHKPVNNVDLALFPIIKPFGYFLNSFSINKKKYFFKTGGKILIFFNVHLFFKGFKKNILKSLKIRMIFFKYFCYKIFFLQKVKKNSFKVFKHIKHGFYWGFDLKYLRTTSLTYFTSLDKYVEWFSLLLDPTIEPLDNTKNFSHIVNLLPDYLSIKSYLILKKKKIAFQQKLKKNKLLVKNFKGYHFFNYLKKGKQSFLLLLFGLQLKLIGLNQMLLHSNSINFFQNFYYFSINNYFLFFNQVLFGYSHIFLFKTNFFPFLSLLFFIKNNILFKKISIIYKKNNKIGLNQL